MSSDLTRAEHRLGYLLLRDGHAVPLRGISPDDIKAGARRRVLHPDAGDLKHQRTLKAIVGCLGFRGDFGDYLAQGWPEFQAFLKREGCTHRAGLFPVDHGGCIDLYLSKHSGPRPRQLADRMFEAPAPAPQQVFLGYGVDWPAWDKGLGIKVPETAVASLTGHGADAPRLAHELYSRRHDLIGQWGFLDDKLVHGPVNHIVDKSYWPLNTKLIDRQENLAKLRAAVQAFRAVFDAQREGWADVLRFNDRLVVLRAHDGAWDVLWRNYREVEPPQPVDVGRNLHLAVVDLPRALMTESDVQRAIHFRQGAWEEREAHEAEQAFYDRGGTVQTRHLASEADVRGTWLREQGLLPVPERERWAGKLPPGFHTVEIAGRKVAMSDLIDVGSFRRMLVETGYAERRADDVELWERANEEVPDDAPVGASWADAQAYCAWKERQLGVALRLPTRDELRVLRPAYSPHYARLADRDFPWENYPPRPLGGLDDQVGQREVPSAVLWSEPRFLKPGPDMPEFPPPGGWSNTSRKRWIEDFPPRAAWKMQLPWAEHGGLAFIDAWDAYEWCQERGGVSGRFWEGELGVTSWGAYKNVKVTFRVVLDLEG